MLNGINKKVMEWNGTSFAVDSVRSERTLAPSTSTFEVLNTPPSDITVKLLTGWSSLSSDSGLIQVADRFHLGPSIWRIHPHGKVGLLRRRDAAQNPSGRIDEKRVLSHNVFLPPTNSCITVLVSRVFA